MQPKSGDVYMMDVYTSNGKSMTDYCYKLESYFFLQNILRYINC